MEVYGEYGFAGILVIPLQGTYCGNKLAKCAA